MSATPDITPGTEVRLVKPKASTNNVDVGDTPILAAGTAGVVYGPWEDNHEWHQMVVSYLVPVRLADVEAIIDDEGEAD